MTDTKTENMIDFVLTNWEEYNELKKKMELYTEKIRDYMEKNDIDVIKREKGKLQKVVQQRNQLDKSLIEDIEKYYRKIRVVMVFKTINN